MAEELGLGVTLTLKDMLSGKAKGASKAVKEMKTEAEGATASFRQFGQVLGGTVVVGALATVTRMFFGLTKEAMEFEESLAKIQTRLEDSSMSLGDLGDKILDVSVKFGSTSQEQMAGMFQILDDGVEKGVDALQVLDNANKLSKGGVVDLGSSIKALTDAMNSWDLQAKDSAHIAEVFLKTDLIGAGIGVRDLAAFMQQASPVAAGLGVSMEELSAVVAGMTSAGIKPRMALKSIDGVLLALTDNAKDLQPLMKKMGLTSIESAIRSKGLVVVLDALIASSKGNQEALAKIGLRGKPLQNFLKLTGSNMENFRDIMKKMQEDSGVLEKKYKQATDNSMQKAAQLRAALEKVRKEIGQKLLIALTPAIEKMGELALKFVAWMDKNPEMAKWIALTIGALAALAGVLTVVAAAATALTFIATPMGLALLGLGIAVIGITAQFVAWWHILQSFTQSDYFRPIADAILTVFNLTRDLVLIFRNDVMPALQTLKGVAEGVFQNGFIRPLEWIGQLFDSIKEKIMGLIGLGPELANSFMPNFSGAGDGFRNMLKNFTPFGLIRNRADQIRSDQTPKPVPATRAAPGPVATNMDLSSMGRGAGNSQPNITNVINVPQSKISSAPVMIDRKKIAEIIFEINQLATIRQTS